MKWFVIALLILISCAPATQDVTTKPISNAEPQQSPKVVAQLESQVKAPQEQTQQSVIQTLQPTETPKSSSQPESCTELCAQNCESSAQNACTQESRPQCKAGCGDIIEPSACVQACTYAPRQPQDCKRLFTEFCTARCVGYCH
jgi:hypothetical protein